jgi:hypothetical protein
MTGSISMISRSGSALSGTHVVDEAFEPIWLCDERDNIII